MGYLDAQVLRYLACGMFDCWDAGMLNYWDAQLLGYRDAWIFGKLNYWNAGPLFRWAAANAPRQGFVSGHAKPRSSAAVRPKLRSRRCPCSPGAP